MQFAVGQCHWLAKILVEMREVAETLRYIEAKYRESDSADELLLESALLLMGDLHSTFLCQQVVLGLIELLLDFATEHILQI